jgi:hypothetical protein
MMRVPLIVYATPSNAVALRLLTSQGDLISFTLSIIVTLNNKYLHFASSSSFRLKILCHLCVLNEKFLLSLVCVRKVLENILLHTTNCALGASERQKRALMLVCLAASDCISLHSAQAPPSWAAHFQRLEATEGCNCASVN